MFFNLNIITVLNLFRLGDDTVEVVACAYEITAFEGDLNLSDVQIYMNGI